MNGAEKMLEEITTENFPKIMTKEIYNKISTAIFTKFITKEIKTQIQEAQRIPSRINPAHTHACIHTHTHPTHIIFKLLETKNTDHLSGSGGGQDTKIKQPSCQKLCKAKNHAMTSLNY